MGWRERTRQDEDGSGGLTLAGNRLGEPPLSLGTEAGVVKRRLQPISPVLQGAWSICVSAAK